MQSDILSASLLDDFYEENERRSPRRGQPTSPSRGGFLSSFSFLRDGFNNGDNSRAGQSVPTSPRRQSNPRNHSFNLPSNSRVIEGSTSQSAFPFLASESQTSQPSKSISGDSLLKSSSAQIRRSQFSFIQADLVPTPSNELAFAIDSPPSPQSKKRASLPMAPPSASIATSDPPIASPRPHDYERQKVSSESALKRIQTDTNRHISTLCSVFEKQSKAYRQLEQLYSTLRSLEAKEQECLDQEDFVRADAVHADWEKTTKQIQYIESESLKGLNDEFGNSWQRLSKLMRQESDAAAKAAEACVVVKEARTRSLEQYITDTNNVQRQKMQHIIDQRAEIEKAKSENAFDYEMWEKAEAEYAEKMDDLVRDEKRERDSWAARQKDIESEIEELLRKVNALKESRDECVERIKGLDATIDKAIAIHQPEKAGLTTELNQMKKKKYEIDARSAEVDEHEQQLQRLQEKHDKDVRRQESEIEALEQKISEDRDRANTGQEDADEIDRIMRTLISDFEKLLEPKLADLASRQQQSDDQRSTVDALCAQLVSTKSKMQRLSKDILIVESQLPDLEEQKAMAVSGRDFKTAAKMSSKIKHLKSVLEQSIIQRQELQQAVSSSDSELKQAHQTLNELIQERKETERTVGEDILQAIQQCRQNLIIARERLSGNQVRVHSLLSSEITSLENRIKYITMKFDISPDLIGELQRRSSKSSLKSLGRSTSKDGEQSTATLDELESLLQQAVADEDYEQADQLQQQIDEYSQGGSYKPNHGSRNHGSPNLL